MRIGIASGLSVAGALAALSFSVVAAAQQPPPRQGGSREGTWSLQRDQLGATASADIARGRARAGDCKGALEHFDAAIRLTIDPTLRRDRGLCHERLGNPYPAIDDFRAYLSATPDAPDADDIRARLARLEEQMGVGGPVKNDDDPLRKPNNQSGATMTVTVGAKTTTYDSSQIESLDDSSPLRRGTGVVLGPYVGGRRWFSPKNFSASLWAETVGVRLAYSWNDVSSLLIELGYEKFNTTEVDAASIGGLSSQLGYEARLAFSKSDVDNYFIIGIGFGYEHLSVSPNGIQSISAATFGGVLGRGRFGWRHNFGASAAFELTADGGGGEFFPYTSGGKSTGTGMLGLNFALLWGI